MTSTPLSRPRSGISAEPRRRRLRPAVGFAASALAVVLVGSGCAALTGDTGADELDRFLDALSAGDLPAAAALTTEPEAAQESITASVEGMGWPAITAGTTGDDGRPDRDPVPVEITWDMGTPGDGEAQGEANQGSDDQDGDDEPGSDPAGGTDETRAGETEADETEAGSDAETARTVTTRGEARTVEVGDEWKVEWSPTILDTRLTDGGRLTFAEELDWDTDILDRAGEPLMQWMPVAAVTLAPEAVDSADAVADLVSGAAPTITGQSIRDGMAEAGDQPYQVVALRPSDADPIREQLAAIDGVSLPEQGQLLRTDRDLGSPVLDGLPGAWTEALQEVGGWSAQIVNPGADPIELGGAPTGQVDDLVSTVQISMQREAQRVVDGSGLAASIVAIQPSTGGVLAVAQNDAADQQGPVSMQGRFPPGSTFKVVTTAAALSAGAVGPDEVVPCPASVTVSGRTIPNDDDFELGPVPMETAFARSCNTSQAIISDRLEPGVLADTAAQLGLGVGFFAPGLDPHPFTGSVPVTERGPGRVEAAIGQGEVLASPFGMAVMQASVANDGQMVLPHVIDGMPAEANQSPEPLEPSVVDTLRRYMEQTVQSGTATAANSIPGLGGKTGTAEVGSGPAHGWFVGSTGDIAVAVLIEGADSSAPAVAMAADFLGGAGQPASLPAG